jgi:hypothetical protein
MTTQDSSIKIWMPFRITIALTALINLTVGFLFIIGPEIGLTLWPSAISSTLMRFIGGIIFANGIGAAMVMWNGKWENARVLFTIALAYGVIVLLALPIDLLIYQKDLILWGYVVLDAIFLIPIGGIFLFYEYKRWRARRTPAVVNAAPPPMAAQPVRGTSQ